MALRVLLADESSTIKKVFQLALQDYAVEVKPVALGVDVLSVAADFRPDIIFADILLQKKNGYEVCAELKSDDSLRSIPVVLMWSGFMELDRDKFEACEADGRLEKPFDVAQLRQVVQDLVSKTKTQSLSNYLEFPETPDFEESEPPAPPTPDQDEEDDFRPISIPKMQSSQTADKSDKFKINLPPDEDDEAELTLSDDHEEMPPEPDTQDLDEDDEDFSFHRPNSAPNTAPQPQSRAKAQSFDLSPDEIKEIVERLAPKIIEEIAWKVVPDLAAQIIEREIKKLLQEKDSDLSP